MADQASNINYAGTSSRRQALNACDACRRRKTKCDEAKPACGRCSRLNLNCDYVETIASKKNLSVAQLNDTLKHMDNKLDNLTQLFHQTHRISELLLSQDIHDHTGMTISPISTFAAAVTPLATNDQSSVGAAPKPHLDTGRVRDELSLSHRHSTAPQHLLSWSCSPLTLSDTELHYPITLEIKRPRLSSSVDPPPYVQSLTGESWLTRLSLSQLSLLTQFYFDHFHPSCLILDETKFYANYLSHAIKGNFANDLETCVVLLVCALGSLYAHESGQVEWSLGDAADSGVAFFNLALYMFRDLENTDWESVRCLLLMGLFYSAKLRVYDAWRVNHQACCTILILAPLCGLTSSSQDTLASQHCQLFWIAYLQESQILAEFDFPTSGLGKLAVNVPLPFIPGAETDPRYAQYQFFFLALISMRKLLNRVLYHLYSRHQSNESISEGSSPTDRPSVPMTTSNSIIQELNRQLEEWRTCLPRGLEFSPYSVDQEEEPLPGPSRSTQLRLRGHLMARYYAAKSIIHRPLLYQALHSDRSDILPDALKLGSRIAVASALLSCIHSGVLNESLTLLLHPINSCRSLFALEIQLAFVLCKEEFHFALPRNWRIAGQMRQQIREMAAHMSPTATRDGEIVDLLI